MTFFRFLGGRRRQRHDTETPDPGQPPLPGKKYLVRTSPHFDETSACGSHDICRISHAKSWVLTKPGRHPSKKYLEAGLRATKSEKNKTKARASDAESSVWSPSEADAD